MLGSGGMMGAEMLLCGSPAVSDAPSPSGLCIMQVAPGEPAEGALPCRGRRLQCQAVAQGCGRQWICRLSPEGELLLTHLVVVML